MLGLCVGKYDSIELDLEEDFILRSVCVQDRCHIVPVLRAFQQKAKVDSCTRSFLVNNNDYVIPTPLFLSSSQEHCQPSPIQSHQSETNPKAIRFFLFKMKLYFKNLLFFQGCRV